MPGNSGWRASACFHTHPVEEVLIFTAGTGEVTLGTRHHRSGPG